MAAAAPYERVAEDMAKGQEYATQLQALLRGSSSSPEAGRLVDQILHAISRTIQTAKAAAAEEEASEVHSDVTCTGGKRKAAAGGGGDKNKAACRRRTHQSSSVVTKSAKDLDDGHAWRKYGQKEIQNCKHPKAYFRCTHKFDQKCAAQRQVQRRDDDPDVYTVTYIGVHTCRDPAAIAVAPLVVHADELHHAGSRLISFGATTTSTTTTTGTGNTSTQQQQAQAAQQLMAGPLKLECGGGGGEQEEVLSSLTPAGSTEATRNAAAAATSGPDQGDVTSGLLQQHCCYGAGGDHLAAAHFGYDDDATFDWTTLCSDSIADIYPEY